MKSATPPFGMRQFHALNERVSAIESEQGERLTRVETKVDIVIDLMRQEREDRNRAMSETHKTERARIGSRTKVVVAVVGAAAAAVGALATLMAGCL